MFRESGPWLLKGMGDEILIGLLHVMAKTHPLVIKRIGTTLLWCFSTAWYGTVRFSTVHFWGFFHWVQYLVLFSVPPQLRFQANRTITKMWHVNSADHWLARENRHCLHHWTCNTRHNRPARFKSAQPAKHRTQLFWMSAPFFNNQKISVSLSVEEVQMFLSLIGEERIQRELDGVTRNEKVFQESRQ